MCWTRSTGDCESYPRSRGSESRATRSVSYTHLPVGIAITPNGKTAYVTDDDSGYVTPIDLATNEAEMRIKVGDAPEGIAITPNGKTAYVVNTGDASVTPIEVANNEPREPIPVGVNPVGIAITPNGKTCLLYTSRCV